MGNIWVLYGFAMQKPDGDTGANHIISQMHPIWKKHMKGIWVSYDFAIGECYAYVFLVFTGWPKSNNNNNHHEIILNSVINARFFINFDYKMNTRI